MKPQRVHLVAAARPNFMKVAPLWHALAAAPDFAPVLIRHLRQKGYFAC